VWRRLGYEKEETRTPINMLLFSFNNFCLE